MDPMAQFCILVQPCSIPQPSLPPSCPGQGHGTIGPCRSSRGDLPGIALPVRRGEGRGSPCGHRSQRGRN